MRRHHHTALPAHKKVIKVGGAGVTVTKTASGAKIVAVNGSGAVTAAGATGGKTGVASGATGC